jgi:gliding motility-associated lipoprotein GldD
MIYLTYKPVENDLNTHLEDSREFVYKHTVMADAIEEIRFENDSLNVYGILYELSGNTASAVQFFLTDSTSHFLRGSLYFNVPPNKDSLAPVIDFIRDDIVYLMESFQWK